MSDEIETLKKQLADAKGRIRAVEQNSHAIERAAKIAQDEASALKAETEASLATAADQMRMAHAVSCGIYGLTRLAQAFMARKVGSGRVEHREMKNLELLQGLIEATAKGDPGLIKSLSDKGKQVIATVKADIESHRVKAAEASIGYGFRKFEQVFDQLIAEEGAVNV